MALRVVTGGQTGADQAGWRAARRCGLPTGGWMPRGFETEDGHRPEFAALYGAVELAGGYRERTQANARDSDATLRVCAAMGRPTLIVADGSTRASAVVAWIVAHYVGTLNVAGNRESTAPGIGARVERFLLAVLPRVE